VPGGRIKSRPALVFFHVHLEVCLTTATAVEARSGFRSLGLSSSLLSVLDRVGYHDPTPIQAAFIPRALKVLDIIGQAQTGTGKTAAFLLPFFETWKDRGLPGPEALVLCPTRELVVQVCEEAHKLSPSKHCRTVPIYGGQRMGVQLAAMKKGCTIAVGTPGRVIDHLSRGTLALNRVRYAVLDEADRMLDLGFRDDIRDILRRCPTDRQTLLLSATMPGPVLRLAQRYQREPVHINLSPEKPTVESIRQYFITVDKERKFELLLRLAAQEKPRQCIIFCERKIGAHRLFVKLRDHIKRVAVMHGDLPQPQRERIMKAFREGIVTYLVATDVVGRGIDVTGISHIFNYDLPADPENYVHRIGRTGRMGKDGVAFAFVTPEEGTELDRIEAFINLQITEQRLEDFEAYQPRVKVAEKPKPFVPVFGMRLKKYSRRL
jgi:ATP-dependent RNA helicase DeaD